MKKINLRKIFIIMMLLVIGLSACGKDESSAYEYGTFAGDIKNKFEIVEGSENGVAVAGTFKTVYINYAHTMDGGTVVWKDSNYGYTSKEDVSPMSICSSFALHYKYIEPMSK